MVNTTLITGILRDASGVILPNTMVQFTRPGPAAQDGAVIPSKTVSATSDASGVISINLYTGNYAAKIMLSPFPEQFQLPVPAPTGSPVDWSGLINAAPTVVTPQSVLDAQAAELGAQTAETGAQTSETAAQGWANASAASAASAASVAQQDLSAISTTMTGYTPVDTALTRMSDWPDGGFNLRVIQPSTSWYNEVTTATGNWLGDAADETAARLVTGAGTGSYYHNTTNGLFYSLNATSGQTEIFRGATKAFPEEVLVVAEAARIILFDATDPAMPMWKVATTTNSGLLWGASNVITSVAIFNGYLYVGHGGGAAWADFVKDEFGRDYISSTSTSIGKAPASLADWNGAFAGLFDSNERPLVDFNVNDVAITVLSDAPIDPATGMQVPTIAVATDGGVSQIGWDGVGIDNVWDVTASGIFSRVSIYKNGRISTYQRTTKDISIFNILTSDMIVVGGDFSPVGHMYREGSFPSIYKTNSFANPDINSDIVFVGGGIYAYNRIETTGPEGVGYLRENPTTPTKGAVLYTTTSYTTGYMVGDIRGAWLADTTAETLTGAELVTNGTFDTDISGWTESSSGTGSIFWDASGYLSLNGTDSSNRGISDTTISTVIGKTYTISWEIISIPHASGALYVGGTVGSSNLSQNLGLSAGKGQATFTATGTTTYIRIYGASGAAGASLFDNITCRLADPDRSVKNNGLQIHGSLTKTAVAPGAELVWYSGFTITDFPDMPYSSDYDYGTGDFAIKAWLKTNSTAGDQNIVSRFASTGTNPDWRFNLNTGTGYLTFNINSVDIVTGSTNLADGNKHFVVVTRQSGVIYLYVDKVLVASAANTTNLDNPAAKLAVGVIATAAPASPFDGSLALVRTGATALSADQVAWMFAEESRWFEGNITLPGTSDAIVDLDYDEGTGLHHVLTSYGHSVFDRGRMIESTAGTWTHVTANNGLVVRL